MRKSLSIVIFSLLCAGGSVFGQSTLPTLPSGTAPDDVCVVERNTSYSSGYGTGYTDGYNQAYSQGYEQGYGGGWGEGTNNCASDPTSCGISLGTVLAEGGYGETEPNDNMGTADALITGAKFLGQTYGREDQDWYYLITTEPNQILTVYFAVPWRDADTANASDWVVEIRDAGGSLYAQFATDFLAGNPNGDDEIAYPVALGLVGAYYIVVKPAVPTTSAYTYQVGAALQSSDLTDPPLGGKFFDAEVEPNNLYTQANPLVSGVTMYGLVNLRFDQDAIIVVDKGDNVTAEAVYGQGEPDWFVYESEGNEIVTLTFCDREVCGEGDWIVQVYDEASAALVSAGSEPLPLVSYNTNSGAGWPGSIRFGLSVAGSYYLLINHKHTYEAPCVVWQPIQECLNTQNLCFVLECGFEDGSGSCSCAEGESSCIIGNLPPKLCLCADVSLPDCGIGFPDQKDICWQQTQECILYGHIVTVPANNTSSQYNFTWFGTRF